MKSPIDDKVRYWQSMLEKWKDSGLSQMAFSMHEGIDSRRLAYWKKALIDKNTCLQIVFYQEIFRFRNIS